MELDQFYDMMYKKEDSIQTESVVKFNDLEIDYVDITSLSELKVISNIEHFKAVLDLAQDERYQKERLDIAKRKNVDYIRTTRSKTEVDYITSSTLFKAISLKTLSNDGDIRFRDLSIGNIGLVGDTGLRSGINGNFINNEDTFHIDFNRKQLRPILIGLGSSNYHHNMDKLLCKARMLRGDTNVTLANTNNGRVFGQFYNGGTMSDSLEKNGIEKRVTDVVEFNSVDDSMVYYTFNNISNITNSELLEHVNLYIRESVSPKSDLKNIVLDTTESKLRNDSDSSIGMRNGMEQTKLTYCRDKNPPLKIKLWRESIGDYLSESLLDNDLVIVPNIHPDVVNDGITFNVHASDLTNEQPLSNLDEGLFIFTTNTNTKSKTLSRLIYKDRYGRVSKIRHTSLNKSIAYYMEKYNEAGYNAEMLNRLKLRLIEKLGNKLFIIEYKRINLEYGSIVDCSLLKHYKENGFEYVCDDKSVFDMDKFIEEYSEAQVYKSEVSDRNELNNFSKSYDVRFNREIDFDQREVTKTSSLCFYRVKVHDLNTFDDDRIYYDRDYLLPIAKYENLSDLINFNAKEKKICSDFKLISNGTKRRLYLAIFGYVRLIQSEVDLGLKDGLYYRVNKKWMLIKEKDYFKYGIAKTDKDAKSYIEAHSIAMENLDSNVEVMRLQNEAFRNRQELRQKDLDLMEVKYNNKLLKAQNKATDVLSKLKEAEYKDIIRKLENMNPIEQLHSFVKCGLDLTKLKDNMGF